MQRRVAAASLHWCEWLVFAAQLNVLWWLGVFAGAVAAGFAPATAAAAELVRSRMRGRDEPVVRGFAAAYRRCFAQANAALLPLAVIGGLVGSSLVFAAQNGLTALVVIAGLAVLPVAMSLAITPALLAHYEVRAASSPLTAWKFALRNPVLCVQLLLAASALAVISAWLPAAGVLFAAGAWLLASTFLCVNRFAVNDRALESQPTL